MLLLTPAALPAQDTGTSAETQDTAQQDFTNSARIPGQLGASQSGFTSRFDNSFNPAIGVTIDMVAEFSDAADSADRYNRFRVRQLELNGASRIDPLGWAYFDASFNDTEGTREAELEEAAVWLDRLPANLSVRAGRFLADFGKWNTVHPHDRAFVNEIGTYREFFGGALFLTGVEVHQWLGVGDVPLRWSAGLSSQAEGDDHDFLAPEDSGTAFGRRSLQNWIGTGRVTSQYDVGQNGYFQWGLSGLYAPDALSFVDSATPSGGTSTQRYELRKAVGAADLTYRSLNAAELTGNTASVELWYGDGQFVDASSAIQSDGHLGLWGFVQHDFSPYWASGLYGSWADQADSTSGGALLAGGETTAERGVFVTWYLSEFNRLRAQVNHVNPGISQDKYFVLALQWDVVLGSHYHSIDW